jgi:hypothetical protein
MLCANCHAKEHYDWARQSKGIYRKGLAGQFLEVEQELAVSQEEEFAHAVEHQYVPDEGDIYDDPDVDLYWRIERLQLVLFRLLSTLNLLPNIIIYIRTAKSP